MNTNQLEYFLSVAEHLNFTKAALDHYVAQTAISQQIAALEREMNATLFRRTTRAVQLTAAGASFYDDAKKILSLLDQAVQKARQFDLGIAGSLSIGFPGKQDYMFLPEVLSHFRGRCPNIAVSLTIDGNDALLRDLESGALDVSFIFCKTLDELSLEDGLSYMEIGQLPLCVALSREHPLAGRSTLTEDELSTETILASYAIYRSASDFERLTASSKRDRSDDQTFMNAVFPEDAIMPMIESGFGVTFWPMFRRSKADSKIVFIPLEGKKGPVMVLAWKTVNDNPAGVNFKKSLLEVLPGIMREYPFIS